MIVIDSGSVSWIVPDVAVTITVLGLGAGEPPHPESALNPAMAKARNTTSCSRCRLLTPNKQTATANIAPTGSLPGSVGGASCRSDAVVAAADTVSVVVAAAPATGVTVAGEKLQVAPAGKPEQANVIVEANPV